MKLPVREFDAVVIGAGDATLGRYSVRTGREDLGDHGSLVTTLSQLQRSAHTGTTTTNDDGVE